MFVSENVIHRSKLLCLKINILKRVILKKDNCNCSSSIKQDITFLQDVA